MLSLLGPATLRFATIFAHNRNNTVLQLNLHSLKTCLVNIPKVRRMLDRQLLLEQHRSAVVIALA
jgi:hypothetical protein